LPPDNIFLLQIVRFSHPEGPWSICCRYFVIPTMFHESFTGNSLIQTNTFSDWPAT